MHIICSWCRQEGGTGLVGEKDPVEDRRETHGICRVHLETVQAQWRAAGRVLAAAKPVGQAAAAETQGVVINARDRFALSPARWWRGMRELIRKAAGF